MDNNLSSSPAPASSGSSRSGLPGEGATAHTPLVIAVSTDRRSGERARSGRRATDRRPRTDQAVEDKAPVVAPPEELPTELPTPESIAAAASLAVATAPESAPYIEELQPEAVSLLERPLPTDTRDEKTVLGLFRRLRGPSQSLRGGNEEALRGHLVMMHSPLVEHCARNFTASGEPVEDLLQEGYFGLIKAVDRFDPDKGVRFSTYACHLITGEIRHYLRDLGKIIHEPGWHSELRQRIARTTEQLAQKIGRTPRAEDIAEALNVRVETVRDVLKNQQVLAVDSLDNERGESDDTDMSDRAEEWTNYTRSTEPLVDDRLMLGRALPQLRELEKKAIQLFFFEELSKTEIAKRLEISVNYAAYLIKQGTQHLRQIIESGESTLGATSPAQMRAAYLLASVKRSTDERGGKESKKSANARAARESSPADLSTFAEFTEAVDDEVRRASRYGQEAGLVWVHIANWTRAVARLDAGQLQRVHDNLMTLAARCCRDVDRIALLPQSLSTGLNLMVLMPHTGEEGHVVAARLEKALSAANIFPANPGLIDGLKVESALAILPRDGVQSEALFRALGNRLSL